MKTANKRIVVILILGISIASAQIKIGDITISDSLAKEYFIDCWKRSDTVWGTFNSEGESQHDGKEWLDKNNKGVLWGIFYYNGRKGKIFKGQCSLEKLMKTDYDCSSCCKAPGWIVPRTPSAFDFAQWYRKQNKAQANNQKTPKEGQRQIHKFIDNDSIVYEVQQYYTNMYNPYTCKYESYWGRIPWIENDQIIFSDFKTLREAEDWMERHKRK